MSRKAPPPLHALRTILLSSSPTLPSGCSTPPTSLALMAFTTLTRSRRAKPRGNAPHPVKVRSCPTGRFPLPLTPVHLGDIRVSWIPSRFVPHPRRVRGYLSAYCLCHSPRWAATLSAKPLPRRVSVFTNEYVSSVAAAKVSTSKMSCWILFAWISVIWKEPRRSSLICVGSI